MCATGVVNNSMYTHIRTEVPTRRHNMMTLNVQWPIGKETYLLVVEHKFLHVYALTVMHK